MATRPLGSRSDRVGLVAHWDAAYADGDNDRSWTQEWPTESLEALASTATRLDAPLIDVGGGSSCLAAALLDAGRCDITVLDLSEAALDLARRRLGGRAEMVTWLAADLLTWQPTRRYAIWHDRASCTSSPTPPTGHATSRVCDLP